MVRTFTDNENWFVYNRFLENIINHPKSRSEGVAVHIVGFERHILYYELIPENQNLICVRNLSIRTVSFSIRVIADLTSFYRPSRNWRILTGMPCCSRRTQLVLHLRIINYSNTKNSINGQMISGCL